VQPDSDTLWRMRNKLFMDLKYYRLIPPIDRITAPFPERMQIRKWEMEHIALITTRRVHEEQLLRKKEKDP